MAGLIIETQIRGVHQYHRFENDKLRIGRAFDNDIILPDLSVSPHHLEIEKNRNGGYTVTNLSNENGSRIGREKLYEGEGRLVVTPTEIWLGASKIRILSDDMPVEPTLVRECNGLFCFYTSPFWAMFLLFLALGFFLFDKYMNTGLDKSLGYYINASFTSMLYLLGFFLVVAGISRLATHRWDIVPAISVASLLFLIPLIAEYMGHAVNYYFSSDTFGNTLLNLVNFLLLPILLTAFMMRIAHSPLWTAVGVSLLVSTPFMAYQASDFVHELTRSDFSALPSYNQTLSPQDIRRQKTTTIIDFIEEAEEVLTEQVTEELERTIKEKQ